MTLSIDSQLNETLRDALVAYYLGEVVPNDKALADLGLTDLIKTPNDLYQYLLLDTQVSHDIQTSPVASAISSLQQYINGVLMGMEPGYSVAPLNENEITEWRDQQSQYPIWAANQQLAIYPEIYLDPSLRIKKSSYFKKLESDINQNKIQIDTTQEAVKAYLASFEEVANLSLINGYITHTDFASGTYYFIGKSPAEKIYYWRSVNMSERAYAIDGATSGPKVDYPNPGAWSDWMRADIPINESTVEHTIRPVYFNSRLFVTWVDVLPIESETTLEEVVKAGQSSTTVEPWPVAPEIKSTTTHRARLRLSVSYKKYDNTWSTPQTYIDCVASGDEFSNIETAKRNIDTVASVDRKESAGSLFLAMYAGFKDGGLAGGSSDTYSLLRCVSIDKNFIPVPESIFPSEIQYAINGARESYESKHFYYLKQVRLFSLSNKYRFQFLLPTELITIKTVVTTAPSFTEFKNVPSWNLGHYQKDISDFTMNDHVSYDDAKNKLVVKATITGAFGKTPCLLLGFRMTRPLTGHSLIVNLYIPVRNLDDEYIGLYMGSVYPSTTPFANGEFKGYGTPFSKALDTPLHSVKSYNINLSIPDAPNNETTYGVTGTIKTTTVQHFLQLIDMGASYNGDYNLDDQNGELVGTTKGAYGQITQSLVTMQQYTFQTCIGYPLYVSTPYEAFRLIAQGPGFEKALTPPATLSHDILINSDTLLPDWSFPDEHPAGRFYLTHGVQMYNNGEGGDYKLLGYALKSTLIEMHRTTEEGELISPKIGLHSVLTLGTAEFIDFTGSSIDKNDGGTAPRQPIRMNTLFARSLIERANIALEYLLSWETQLLEEPSMSGDGTAELMDFHGANSLYFWELFLHLPFLISHRLNLEQQFDQAETWLGFIFDPGRKSNDSGRPDYWNVRALIPETVEPDYAMRAPIDPDGIASSYPVHYQKAVYAHYIKNLIDRGDRAYRQLTPDSLSEARLWYARTLDLLGPRPDAKVVSQWTPITLKTLAESQSSRLRAFEKRMSDSTARQLAASKDTAFKRITYALPMLRISTCGSDPTLSNTDNEYLLNPFNSQLVVHWDTVESRIYNLGHNRTLDGKPLSLPLFAAPLDPKALLASFAAGASSASSASLLAQEIPHYRFSIMHSRAYAAVDTLIQFGSTLLSLIERKEQAELQELQQHQAWEFAQFAIDIQLQTQVIEQKNREALIASQTIVRGRLDYYTQLSDEVVSASEIAAGALHLAGRVSETVAISARGVGAVMKVLPNHIGAIGGAIVGMSNGVTAGSAVGGFRLEGVPEVVEALASLGATQAHGAAEAVDRAEGYRRRHQEWTLARDQAQLELNQIDVQLRVLDEQKNLTAKLLMQSKTALDQAKSTFDFLGKRFTHSQLYQWLNGQYATFYYQAYDATLSLCMAAQASWQYELCDYTTTFIKPGAWSDAYRGLTAGESLKLNLIKMEAAYLSLNERRLEITKTVSLRDLKKNTALPEDGKKSENESWEDMFEALKANGVVHFKLPVHFFDNDYPGQYQRRLSRVSVSLPAVIGPYQNIRAMLTQTYNAVQIAAGEDSPLKENLRASQQIALSTGVDDDGMFQLRFDDERYLPFEGTGAISNWTLSFPNHKASVPSDEEDGEDDQPMLRAIESLTDIIIRVSYTAKQGPLPPEDNTAKGRKKSKALHRRSI